MKRLVYPLIILLISIAFFWQFFFKGLLPIPSDTIIGLYHPFRDLYAKDYPRGVPFKNFLITDPVKQQIPWKKLAMELEKKLELPLWNPYNFSGTPHLANFQSGVFYPPNIFLIILPFNFGWSLIISIQVFLAGFFMYLYLKNQNLKNEPSLIGAISFSLSGFFIAWLEWGNIIHTALWLPLILLSIDKIFENKGRKWSLFLILALSFSFFAGHLQTFFYIFIVSAAYTIFNLVKTKNNRALVSVIFSALIFGIISLPQLIPTLQFISFSARNVDLNWHSAGWFIPLQNLAQFLVPDYFGNPATLNYFGTWNYGEFIGYVGILPLAMSIFALFAKERRTAFFLGVVLISLIFATDNPVAKIPFSLNIPFMSTSQPTRLIFLIDFSLAILSAIGFQRLMVIKKRKEILLTLGIILFAFLVLLSFTFFGEKMSNPSLSDLLVSRRNSYFPIIIFAGVSSLLLLYSSFKNKNIKNIILISLVLITLADLFRFGWKFTPFTDQKYLFPQTKIIDFLKNQEDKNFRVLSASPEIFPPNFSTYYKIQMVEGYDPLYLLRYAELIKAIDRGNPDISPPFGFNRIVSLSNSQASFSGLLNVKYLLTLDKLSNPNYRFVMEEGKTNVYENKKFIPRAFFVSEVKKARNKQEAINLMFKNFNPRSQAVVENYSGKTQFGTGSAEIVSYLENKIVIQTDNRKDGFLVLLDSYYPTWEARIDDANKKAKIFLTDYNFRGIVVPSGKHMITFENFLFKL